MPRNANFIPQKFRPWIDARESHRLSHGPVQMARELGMNPKKLGKIDNHRQEPWKLPLPLFIEKIYEKRFGRKQPLKVISMEEAAQSEMRKRQTKRVVKAARKDKLG